MPWNETQGEQASTCVVEYLPVWLVKTVHLHACSRPRQRTSCIRVTQTWAVFEKHKLLNLGALSTVQHRSSKEIIKLQNTDVLSTPWRFICLQSGPSRPLHLVIVLNNLHWLKIFSNHCLALCCSPLLCNLFVTSRWNPWCRVWHEKLKQMSLREYKLCRVFF